MLDQCLTTRYSTRSNHSIPRCRIPKLFSNVHEERGRERRLLLDKISRELEEMKRIPRNRLSSLLITLLIVSRPQGSRLLPPPSARGPEARWTEDTEGTKRDSTRFFKALERCKADRCWERFGGVGWRTALCALARVSRNRGHLAARMTMHHHRRTGYFRTFPHFYPFTYFPRTYVRVRLLYTGTRDIRLWTLRMSPRAATHPATCR